jgi:cytochrome b561
MHQMQLLAMFSLRIQSSNTHLNFHSERKMQMLDAKNFNSNNVTQPWQHNRLSVIMHWLTALLIPVLAGLGWYMLTIENEPNSGWYFNLHKSLGIVFFILVVIRLAWRLAHPSEPLPSSVPVWQARSANYLQKLLYISIFTMPITGYLGTSFGPDELSAFGLKLPQWATPNHASAELYFNIHSILIWIIACLVGIHVAGALKHLLVDKDQIFQRMWFKSK